MTPRSPSPRRRRSTPWRPPTRSRRGSTPMRSRATSGSCVVSRKKRGAGRVSESRSRQREDRARHSTSTGSRCRSASCRIPPGDGSPSGSNRWPRRADPMARRKIRIGELLVDNHVISEAQLQSALAEQKKSGLKLGRQLIEAGYVDEDRFLDFLSRQLDIPNVDLARYETRPQLVELLPETYARRFRAIVLDVKDGVALVGMADPTNIFAM